MSQLDQSRLVEKLVVKPKLKPLPAPPAPSQKRQETEPLPEAPEIEKAVLQVIFANSDQGFSAFEHSARKSFFTDPVNRELYNIARAFHQDKGLLEWIAFMAHLQHLGRFEALGGRSYITDLFVSSVTPPFEMLGYYIGQLSELYVRRQLIVRSFAMAAKAKTGDIDNLLSDMASSVDDLRRAGTGQPTLCDASLYTNGNCPPMPPEVIYQLLHQGSKMIVGGTSKGRKTMALIDAGVSVVSGSEWWGFRCRKGPVCYINFEIQEPFFWYRVNQVCERKGVEIPPGMFYAWNLRGRAAGLERLRDEILGVLKLRRFVLIIIDPIYKALGDRDENRAGDVASMLNEVEKIAVETGAAVAFGAHYSKGNQAMKESIDRIGGSGVFTRDPDTILTMTPHEEEEHFTVEGTLRNFPPMRPFVVKWEWPLFVRSDADPNNLKKARGAERSPMSTGTIDDLFALIPPTGSIDQHVLLQQAAEPSRGDKRIGLNKGRAYLTALIDSGRAFRWLIKRPKTNPRVEISRYEQILV